jgi:hypothetical protein
MPDDLNEPPIEEWFWALLSSSERDLRSLCRQLEALPKEQLFHFQRQYADAMDYLHPRDWDDPLIPPSVRFSGVGDDFGAWVVSQGKPFYYEVRSNPARLPEYLHLFEVCDAGSGFPDLRWNCEVDRDDYRGWQSPAMIAFAIFQARFGNSMQPAIYGGSRESP